MPVGVREFLASVSESKAVRPRVVLEVWFDPQHRRLTQLFRPASKRFEYANRPTCEGVYAELGETWFLPEALRPFHYPHPFRPEAATSTAGGVSHRYRWQTHPAPDGAAQVSRDVSAPGLSREGQKLRGFTAPAVNVTAYRPKNLLVMTRPYGQRLTL